MQDLARYVNPSKGLPTVQSILDIVNFRTSVGRVNACCRLRHEINGQIIPYYLPDPPDPNDPTNISKWVEKVVLNQNTSQDVQRDADFTIREIPTLGQFNTPKDLIQTYVQYRDEFDDVILDVPMGIFRFIEPDRTLRDVGNFWEIKGYDLTSRLAGLSFMDTYVIPKNYAITDAIRVILMADFLPPSEGGRYPYGQTPVQGGGSASGSGNLVDFSATQRNGSFPGTAIGTGSTLLTTADMVGILTGTVKYYTDSNTPKGYARALYSGPVPDGDITWAITDGVPSPDFNTMCGIGGTSGSGAGYCPTGYAVADTRSGCVGARQFNGTYVYTHPATSISYNPSIGQKIDPSSGSAIDPVSCTPMSYVTITDGDGIDRHYMKTADGAYFFNTITGDFTPQSPYFAHQVCYDPKTGEKVFAGSDVLNTYGGDGGVQQGTGVTCPYVQGGSSWNIGGVWAPGFAPNETPAFGTFVPMGSGYSQLSPVTTSGWPDPNNPGLTPAGCDDIGPNIPASRIDIVHSDLSSPVPIVFNRKTNKLAAINQLLKAINYYPLWADENGVFRSSPIPYYADLLPQSTWTYRTDNETSTFRPDGITLRLGDQTQLANVVQVISAKNNAKPIVSVKYNKSINSAISTTNLGFAILKVIQDDNIPTQSVADLRAIVELQYAAIQSEGIDFVTMVNPFHQSSEQLDVNVLNRNGVVEVVSANLPFEETAWSADLNSMSMSHTAGRIVPI